MFKLEIHTDYDAFRDEYGNLDLTAWQVKKMLREVDRRLTLGYSGGSLLDVNGNKVGYYIYED